LDPWSFRTVIPALVQVELASSVAPAVVTEGSTEFWKKRLLATKSADKKADQDLRLTNA
jgi:hypothetical protein